MMLDEIVARAIDPNLWQWIDRGDKTALFERAESLDRARRAIKAIKSWIESWRDQQCAG